MTTYAFNKLNDHTVKAYGTDLGISTKTSINICNKLRGMDAAKAVAFLSRVQNKEEPVPFTRFMNGVGHRRGMAAGRYPLKASIAIGEIIKSAIANAANQGFAEELKIVHICAHKAGSPMHQGRQRRRVMKKTHIEVVLAESETKTTKEKKTKTQSKAPTAEKQSNAPLKKEAKSEIKSEVKPEIKSQSQPEKQNVKEQPTITSEALKE